MAVYVLHFDAEYPRDERSGVTHYVGFCNIFTRSPAHVISRMLYHQRGNGSRLMDAINKAGIGFRVVRVWWGADRNFERSIKNRRATRVFCPVCNPKLKRHLLRADYWNFPATVAAQIEPSNVA